MPWDLQRMGTKFTGGEWREEYKRKQMTADEAVKLVKPGDRVYIPLTIEPQLLGRALGRRKDEFIKLGKIKLVMTVPDPLCCWDFLQPGAGEAFDRSMDIYFGDYGRTAPEGGDSRHTPFGPFWTFGTCCKYFDERPETHPYTKIDAVMVSITPPDEHGLCTFGPNLWTKRMYCQRATTVLAEVNTGIRRCEGGTNYIHVSEIDAFCEFNPPEASDKLVDEILAKAPQEVRDFVKPLVPKMDPGSLSYKLAMLANLSLPAVKSNLAGSGLGEPPPECQAIANYLSEVVKDGDCFQIGTGIPSQWMVTLGAFDNKHDLGYHAEMMCPGVAKLGDRGIITCKRKNFHPGKVITGSTGGADNEDVGIMDGNAMFEQWDQDYVMRTIPMNDNYCAINNIISVDLTGQINSETGFGSRIINGIGGQPEHMIFGIYSKGGKAIALLRSTAMKGTVSTIVPQLDQGAAVTIPRYLSDYVITEHGIARLAGKDSRQRAEELIAVAHPDFRAELKKSAQKLFYP